MHTKTTNLPQCLHHLQTYKATFNKFFAKGCRGATTHLTRGASEDAKLTLASFQIHKQNQEVLKEGVLNTIPILRKKKLYRG